MSGELSVQIESRTCSDGKHGLFDFEAQSASVNSQVFTIRNSANCLRNGDSVQMCSKGLCDTLAKCGRNSVETLVKVTCANNQAFLARSVQSCYQLIRGGDLSSVHRLAEDDVLKLGSKSHFRVRQVSVVPGSVRLNGAEAGACHVDLEKLDEQEHQTCRICLEAGSSMEDPLLAPCQCQGSIQHIHMGCWKHWVRDRLGLTSDDFPFSLGGANDAITCELCKAPYQKSVQIAKGEMPLMSVPLIDMRYPFIVLENCKDGQLHVLPILPGRYVKIGRGPECNLSLPDMSISRVQAAIEFRDGAFLISDTTSRYGTYVKINEPVPLEPGRQVTVQIGRTILRVSSMFVKTDAEALLFPAEPQLKSEEESFHGEDLCRTISTDLQDCSGVGAADSLEVPEGEVRPCGGESP